MSHGYSSVTLKDVKAIVEADVPQEPKFIKPLFLALIAIGIAAFAYELTLGESLHAWTALQVNFLFWFFLSCACTCFTSVFHICNAQWVRPIRRLFEAGSVFFLYSWIPLLVLYFGHHELFDWSHGDVAGKGVWLTSYFFYARGILAILLLVYVSRKVIFLSISRDIGAIRGGLTGLSENQISRWNDVIYDKFVEGWGKDTKAELLKAKDRMGRLSPIVVMCYAFIMTLIAFDQVMSVDQHWFSTLFGALCFMGAIYVCMATVSMLVPFARKLSPLFMQKVERRTLWDLGKLLFGFGIFWAYMFWSHYLPIWYGNMPEETGWLILRLREQPWHCLAWCVLGLCFILPFLLGLSRDIKQMPWLLASTGLIVAIGFWLEIYVLFAPTLFPDHIPIGLIDVLIGLGFMGAFLLGVLNFMKKYPLMPFGDLYVYKDVSVVGENNI